MRGAPVRPALGILPLDENAEMIGGEARFASGVGEGECLLTEHLHGALKLDGGELPKPSANRIAVGAESFRAVSPEGGQIARYDEGLHT
jgi:hypothetical protein